MDGQGNKIELNQQQKEYLTSLSKAGESQRKEPSMAEEVAPVDEAPDVDYNVLRNMNPVELNKILQENKEVLAVGGGLKTQLLSKKKLFNDTQFQNSEEFKALGNMSTENRVINYFPQDDKNNFGTRPVIFNKYDFGEGGLSLQHRIPDNLIGESLKAVRENTDTFNKFLAQDMTSYTTVSSGFPLTTNQDFHSDEVFGKAKRLAVTKKNNKKKNVYNLSLIHN